MVRALDERGDPITDYNLQLLTGEAKKLRLFGIDVHSYSADKSLRCFHVNLSKLKPEGLTGLQIRVIASSGSRFVSYHGVGSEKMTLDASGPNRNGKWDAMLDLLPVIGDQKLKFFFPYTTTLLELRLNREPMPLTGFNDVLWFEPRQRNPGP